MKLNKRDRITYLFIIGFFLIVIAGFTAWFLKNFELVEHEVRSGMSKEARRNPFLAAELFLREVGVEVESVSGRERLHELPPENHVLVVNNLGPNLSPARYQALLDWIRAGGHLVTTAHRVWDDETGKSGDQLLDELGVQLEYAYADEDEENDDYDEISSSPAEDENVIEITFEGGQIVKVNFDKDYTLVDSEERATAWAKSDYGTHLLQIPMGEGMITIMSDNRFLTNPRDLSFLGQDFSHLFTSIAEHDHAYYLWLLVNTDSKVWLLYSMQTEGLLKLIWRNARMACISFLVLLLAWLLWQRNRFGPGITSLEQPRRNLLEHIQMAGNFSWRQDNGQQLYQRNREQFFHWLTKKHPQIASLPEDEQCFRLAELCNISTKKIHHALFGSWRTEREFIQLTHTLQILRKRL